MSSFTIFQLSLCRKAKINVYTLRQFYYDDHLLLPEAIFHGLGKVEFMIGSPFLVKFGN